MLLYLPAVVIVGVALLVLTLLVARTAVLVRRFVSLSRAYRRQLAAESAMLAHRQAGLRTELARHGGRTPRQSMPRTM